MKVHVDSLRWLLLAVTLVVIGGTGYTAVVFTFQARGDELSRERTDPTGFVVQPQQFARANPAEVNRLAQLIIQEAPNLKPEIVKTAKEVIPVGGPLAEGWELLAIMTTPTGVHWVSLREKSQKRVVRGRPNSSSKRGSRGSTKRTPRGKRRSASAVKTRHQPVGEEFRIDGKPITVESVEFEPQRQITYSTAGGKWILAVNEPENQIREENSKVVIFGLPTDPDEAKRLGVEGKTRSFIKGGASPTPGGSKASSSRISTPKARNPKTTSKSGSKKKSTGKD